MGLLTLCQEVADEIGVISPSSIIGNSDQTAKRLLAVANAEGKHLARARDWAILHREYTFETTAGTANYPVPADWLRPLGNTAWDRSTFIRLRGNKSPAQWQVLKSGLVASVGLCRNYRLIAGPLAGSILIDPTPGTTGDTLVIEYISANWAESAVGAGKPSFTDDTDNVRIDEEVFRLGLLWRARRALGFDYIDERADAEHALRMARTADINLPIIELAPSPVVFPANIPEGSWPDGT